MEKCTEMDNIDGLMVVSMKENIKRILEKEKEDLNGKMEFILKEILSMGSQMEKGK